MPVRIDANMKIQVVVYSTTPVSVNVAYRESINGEMRQPRQANIVSSRITTDAVANYFYFTMAGTPDNPSELQNVVVGLATASVQRGQCFVRVGITIGGTDGTASDPIEVLFSDYVTSNSFLAYPGTGINSSLDGPGYQYLVVDNTLADYSIPSNKIVKLTSALINYTNSTAGDQLFQFQIERLAETMFSTQSKFVQGTGKTYTYSGFIGNGDNFPAIEATLGTVTTFCLPDNMLKEGDLIIIAPIGADPGDSIEKRFNFEQWISA